MKPKAAPKKFLKVREAALLLGVSRFTVDALIEGGKLPAHDASPTEGRRLWRIDADAIQDYLREHSS